ncbi:MAG: hypothetical protein HQ575_05690 [Candidatus Omnitrophica bacterium]|nr:hypothetical protein [Candidatus Omnitrophota bacterium]
MARKVIVFMVIIGFVFTALLPYSAYAGWKENYRNKYSKKTIDPKSQKAKDIKTLCNLDFKYKKKWRRTAKEREALGLGPTTSLSESLMPWRRGGESKDKFVSYDTNFVVKKEARAEDTSSKSGYTLTGCIQTFGKTISETQIQGTPIKESTVNIK